MPVPVKVSDRLLALAKEEGRGTHRSATAQIEHWATLGRAVEAVLAYHEVLALKRVGPALPVPKLVTREDVHDVLSRLVEDPDREGVQARIRATGGPVYAVDPANPEAIVEVRTDRARVPGRLVARRFVAAKRKSSRKR